MLHTEEASDGRMKTGLDLSVEDMWNAKTRSVSSLSGGEKFKQSCRWPWGCRMVMGHAGGVEIIHCLSMKALAVWMRIHYKKMKVLQSLALDDRLIGVISHLDLLRQVIKNW